MVSFRKTATTGRRHMLSARLLFLTIFMFTVCTTMIALHLDGNHPHPSVTVVPTLLAFLKHLPAATSNTRNESGELRRSLSTAPYKSTTDDLAAFTRARRLSLSESTTATSSSSKSLNPLPVNCLADYLEPMRQMQQINHRNGTKSYRSLRQSPSFVDTNQGQLLSRYLDGGALPAFFLSIHHEKADKVRWSVMQFGRYYEQVQDQLFIDILTDAATRGNGSPPTLRVVDVGGNIGYFTLRSAAVAASLQVPYELIAFEPNPVNIARFCESLWLNADTFFAPSTRRTTVDIYQQGVSDKAAILNFSLPHSSNPGTGTFRDSEVVRSQLLHEANQFQKREGRAGKIALKSVAPPPTQEIPVTTLDAFAKYRGWWPVNTERVDIHILKIDVEGLEPAVVQGAIGLLESGLVWNVIMEISCGTRGDAMSASQALWTIYKAGYRLQGQGKWSGPTPGSNPWGNGNGKSLIQGILKQCEGNDAQQLNLWWQHPSHPMKNQVVIQ
jgi:FkbM family methyltransferase